MDRYRQTTRQDSGIRDSGSYTVTNPAKYLARMAGYDILSTRVPWQGDPRVNIQNKNGKAKSYQVKQVLKAIEKLEVRDDTKK